MKKLIVLLAALTMTSYAHAENIAIVGGEVHTMTSQGVIENGTVLLSDGLIAVSYTHLTLPTSDLV